LKQDYAQKQCDKNQDVKIAIAEDTPIFWGLYTSNLEAGDYQLFLGNFKVYQGKITIEIIDGDMRQINKYTFNPSSSNASIPFNLKTSQKQIEVRILADYNTQFTLPSHFIIAS
jgi:hypothetical protein